MSPGRPGPLRWPPAASAARNASQHALWRAPISGQKTDALLSRYTNKVGMYGVKNFESCSDHQLFLVYRESKASNGKTFDSISSNCPISYSGLYRPFVLAFSGRVRWARAKVVLTAIPASCEVCTCTPRLSPPTTSAAAGPVAVGVSSSLATGGL